MRSHPTFSKFWIILSCMSQYMHKQFMSHKDHCSQASSDISHHLSNQRNTDCHHTLLPHIQKNKVNMGMFSFGDLDVPFLQTNNSRLWLSAGKRVQKMLCGIQFITSNVTVYGIVTMAVPHCLQSSSLKHGWKLCHNSCATSLKHLKFVLRLH